MGTATGGGERRKRRGWARDRRMARWRLLTDGVPVVGMTADRRGMADAVEGMAGRCGRGRLVMALAHGSGVRRRLGSLLRGWGGGELRVSLAVHRRLEDLGGVGRFGWGHGYEVSDIHLRYASVEGEGGRGLWMGTASLEGHVGTPEWSVELAGLGDGVLGGGGPVYRRVVGNGGVWLGRHRNWNMRLLVEGAGIGEPRYWATFYAHPDMVRWASRAGCRVLVAGAQKSMNPEMMVQMRPYGVRQWTGHAKLVVGSGGVLLTTMNGGRYGTGDRGGEEELTVVLRDRGAARYYLNAMGAVWGLSPPLEASRPRRRAGLHLARAVSAALRAGG